MMNRSSGLLCEATSPWLKVFDMLAERPRSILCCEDVDLRLYGGTEQKKEREEGEAGV